MRNSIKFTQLPSGSIIRFGFFANLGIWIPIGILLGVLGSLGFNTVRFGGENVYGIKALIAGPIITLVFAMIGTIFFYIGSSVLKLLPWVTRRIDIELRPEASEEAE